MRKIIVNHASQSKYDVKDLDGKPVKAFEFIFDDHLLTVLETLSTGDLKSYKVKGRLFTDTGIELANCDLEVSDGDKYISYDGFLRNAAGFELCGNNDFHFERIATDQQNELELSK